MVAEVMQGEWVPAGGGEKSFSFPTHSSTNPLAANKGLWASLGAFPERLFHRFGGI